MKLDMKHEHGKGDSRPWTCNCTSQRMCRNAAVIGEKDNWQGLCLEHLPLLKGQPWQTAFVPQEITGTLRAAVRDYVLSLWPDAEQPEAVTAPDKIGCRTITYSYECADANGYKFTREQLKAMHEKCESLAPKPERKTVWRFKRVNDGHLDTYGSGKACTYDSREAAEKQHLACMPQTQKDWTFVRVLGSDPDVEAPEVRYEVRFDNEPLTGERENKGRPTHPVCGFESRESASEWLTLRAKWAAADERRYTIHEIPA